jgi:type VI secretion system protein ImpL
LLAAIEKLGTDTAWTFFMPGSWRAFDDLEERAAERIEREFGEIAINTLRRELYGAPATLTGVAQDASTGELIIGGECIAPPVGAGLRGRPAAHARGEDVPEFSAVLQYLGSVEQLDSAMQAMIRLQRPSQTEAADLRLLVKYTLGATCRANISRSLRFFRGTRCPAAAPSLPPPSASGRCSRPRAAPWRAA